MNKKNKISTRKGLSFVEMIIAIGIFSLMMVGITTFFVKSWDNYNYVMDTNSSSISASQGISGIVDNIRRTRNADNGAYPIKSVGDFDLVIFSDYDKDGITEKVHYYLDNGTLKMGSRDPSGVPPTYSAGDSNTSVVVNNVVNNASQPVFYYYDNSNNIINNPDTNLSNIRMIKVNLIVEGNSANNVNTESFASLRNLSENDTIQ